MKMVERAKVTAGDRSTWLSWDQMTGPTASFRWIRAEQHPQPATRVVKFADLVDLVGGKR